MQFQLDVPAERRVAVARALKEAYDPWDASQTMEWGALEVGGGGAHAVVQRLLTEGGRAPVQFPGGDPTPEAAVIVVPVGYVDEYTGDAQLASGTVVEAGPDAGQDEQHLQFWSEALPAVALYAEEGRVGAVVGRIVVDQPPIFAAGCNWPELEAQIAAWVQTVAREAAA